MLWFWDLSKFQKWKIFSKFQQYVPIFVIIFARCVCQTEISLPEVNTENNNVCAHFNVTEGKSFDLFDGANFSQGLDDVFNSKFNEFFISVKIVDDCVLRICVLNYLIPNNPVRRRECRTLNQSQDFDEYNYVVTTRCSCQTPTAGCENQKCENVSLGENECVRLFVEQECSECRFNSISILDGESLFPTNGFTTESFVVKDGCRLRIQSIGNQNESYHDRELDPVYEGIHSSIQLNYVLRPIPSKFTCSCEPNPIEQQNPVDNPDITDSSHLDPIVITLLAAIPALVVIAVAAVLIRRRLSLNRKNRLLQEKINSDIIKRFEKGNAEIDNKKNPPEESSLSEAALHYVSIGFNEALLQPYQNRFEVPRSNVRIEKVIARGNFGVVSYGKLKQNDGSIVEVAIKETKASANPTYFTSLLDEIKILSFIGTHPNIVSLVGACTQDCFTKNPLLLLEFCTHGSLKTYLKTNRESFLERTISISISMTSVPNNSDNGYASFESISNISEMVPVPRVTIIEEYFQYLIKWSMEIAAGMEFLSQKKVVHIDLATRNVLLTKDFIAKISDFGLSQRLRDYRTYVRLGDEYPLPIRWMSMESLTEQQFTPASDVWSYGVTLWEIFSLGENPYKNVPMNYAELVAFLKRDERLSKPVHATNEIYNEMHKCWAKDPEDRPSFRELQDFFESLGETYL